MKNSHLPVESSRSNVSKTLRLIFGGLAGLAVLAVLGGGLIVFRIYRSATQVVTDIRNTVEEVKRDFEADRVEHRARLDENRRRDLVEYAKASSEAYKNKFEFTRKRLLDRERIVADSPFPDFDPNPKSGYCRAVREDPESFAREFRIRDAYLPKLEAARTLEDCQRVVTQLQAEVLKISIDRYRPELESLRATVAQQLGEIDAETYCVIEVTPPISEFEKAVHGAAFVFDISTGMWMFSAANLGETPALPFSSRILENAGKPRVAVVRTRENAVEYIVESVFAENHFEGAFPAACPWRLITAVPDEQTAQAAAEQAAARLRAQRKHVRDSGKAADPRPVVVVRVPDGK